MEPTKNMKEEAAISGFYIPQLFPQSRYPKIQILTIEELFKGKKIEYYVEGTLSGFKKAERKYKFNKQLSFLD